MKHRQMCLNIGQKPFSRGRYPLPGWSRHSIGGALPPQPGQEAGLWDKIKLSWCPFLPINSPPHAMGGESWHLDPLAVVMRQWDPPPPGGRKIPGGTKEPSNLLE
ncbi:hypothetical protein KIL84_003976 [Mauremys mutica]|uniref:Uncharacterized protein n=1 Tax=Mauremys mutica TaxID=74926 RepID=A0A9D4ARS1_9SAUR|nr:hypothetical protein KIL84_003976 [Mauremys mutica]